MDGLTDSSFYGNKRGLKRLTWPGRIQQLFDKKEKTTPVYGECWAEFDDDVLVIYHEDSVPDWLKTLLEARDDNGNLPAEMTGVVMVRAPREGEYEEGIEPASVIMEGEPA